MRQNITRYTPYDVKVYKCDYCGDEYKWKCNLKRHMKEKHDGHDGEIGLPTKAYTPGTPKTEGQQKNCTSKNFIALEKILHAKMREFNRKIEIE